VLLVGQAGGGEERAGEGRCRRSRSKERLFRTLAFSGAAKVAPSAGAGGSEF
jgi:hypothetical protein